MPNRSKQKGDRLEREIVELLRANGLDAYRIPLSGAQRGFKGDIEVRLRDSKLTLEAKSRANGFQLIYKALGSNDLLAIKQDRQEPLIVMRLKDVVGLLGVSQAGVSPPWEAAEPAQPQSTATPAADTDYPPINREDKGWRNTAAPVVYQGGKGRG